MNHYLKYLLSLKFQFSQSRHHKYLYENFKYFNKKSTRLQKSGGDEQSVEFLRMIIISDYKVRRALDSEPNNFFYQNL